MMHKDTIQLYELIVAMHESDITDAQFAILNKMLQNKASAREYVEFITIMSGLACPSEVDFYFDQAGFGELHDGEVQDINVTLRGVDTTQLALDTEADPTDVSELTQAMLELLEMERKAPTIEVEKPFFQKPRVPKFDNSQLNIVRHRKSVRRSIAFALSLAASFLLVVGYLHFFVPIEVERPVVAKLSDSIDAVWDNKLQTPDTFDDMVQSSYGLKEGYASILFNNGAKVTIEAPAELSLNSDGDMELLIGRIYAIVPPQAQGFTVKAGSSKIIDLGTEFGVEVDDSGSTQLYVTKGRTVAFTGLLSDKKQQISVDAGSSKKIYNDGFVKDIEIVDDKFVRRIDSQDGSIYKGQLRYRNLNAGGKTFNACFEEYDGKTWLLIGRGREGWQFDADGQGSIAEVGRNLRTPAAFMPACYSDAIVNDLLSQAGLTMEDVEIRISRATTVDGKGEYQDIRWRDFNSADNGNTFTWNFDNSRYSNITIEYVNAPAKLPGASAGSIVGDTYDTSEFKKSSDESDRLFTHLPEVGVNNGLKGFSYGKEVGGLNTETSFLLSYEYSGPLSKYNDIYGWAIPYTEVYIEYPDK